MTGKRKQSTPDEKGSSSDENLDLFTRIRPAVAAVQDNESEDGLNDDDTTDSDESEYSGLEEEEEEDSLSDENESELSQPSDFDSDDYGSEVLSEKKSDLGMKNITHIANASITDAKGSPHKSKNIAGDRKNGDQVDKTDSKTLNTDKSRVHTRLKVKTKTKNVTNSSKAVINRIEKLELTDNVTRENDAEGDDDDVVAKDTNDDADDDERTSKEKGKVEVDEYAEDSSDEEDIRNTVGNIPMEWYRDYDHIGYTVEGKKLKKPPQADQLDSFLRKMDDPEYWRTVTNKMTGQDIVLSVDDVKIIQRMREGNLPRGSSDPYKPWVDFFTNEVMIHPVTNRPEDKRSFIPSKWERLRVGQYVDALRKGWMKPTPPPKTDEQLDDEAEKEHNFFMLWKDEDEPEITRRHRAHIPAPKLPLPGHAESYNPPPEYLFDEEEEKKWNEAEREDRKLNFLPHKYPNMRLIPGFHRFVNERFDRCLDLYLCPRQRKMKMNVNPEDLIPKLPKPRDLQPFPTQQAIIYYGHKGLVRCVTVDPTGQWIASGSDDQTVKFWEVSTGRCMKTLNIGSSIKGLAWNPNSAVCLVAINSEKKTMLVNANLGDKLVCSATDKMLDSYDDTESSDTPDKQLPITWTVCTGADYDTGFRINISHPKDVRQVSWHAKGDYLATVMPLGEAMSVIIHQVSKRRSQNPFRRAKGLVQCVLFHPLRPFLFVATQQYVRVYNLMKQELSKKLMTNCKWVSSMAVHPGGDNLIVGSYDSRLAWFDLDLSTKPYHSLRHHKKAVRQVAYHKRYPLFASASDDCTVIICHGRVYNDLMKNPLIVPVKVLRGHQGAQNLGVLDCVFHPTQPWIFSAGADGTVRLYT